MLSISNEYKQAIYAPSRMVKVRVTFDISELTLDDDVVTTNTSSEFIISDKQQLTDKQRENTFNYATLEDDRFKLDGSFSFADENINNNKIVGWCSEKLSDNDGVFQENLLLTFNFNKFHSSGGITISFDVINNEYATDFEVQAFNNELLVLKVEVVDNQDARSIIFDEFSNFNKIQVIIKKWSKPNHRARVAEVDFGITQVYTDEKLVSCSLVEEVDLMSSTIPVSEFTFTVENSDKAFNILNPYGIYKYLQERQKIVAELGVELENGIIEYYPLCNFLLRDWISDEGSLTTTFTARTNLDLMETIDYENEVAKLDYSLYQIAYDLFTMCGISNFEIDENLLTVFTNGIISKTNCKEALQMVAIAGCCTVIVTRENKIKLQQIKQIPNIVDEIDLENMYIDPQIQLEKATKTVRVQFYEDMENPDFVEVNKNNSQGDVLSLENNTLINSREHALTVANWISAVKNNRAIYTIDWRGNGAHELNDIVSIENIFGNSNRGIITKNQLNYEGYLSAITEARGEVN